MGILPRSFLVFSFALIIHEQKDVSKEVSSVTSDIDPEAIDTSSTFTDGCSDYRRCCRGYSRPGRPERFIRRRRTFFLL